jgi:hypothetical protein
MAWQFIGVVCVNLIGRSYCVRLCVGLYKCVCMSVHVVLEVQKESLDIEKNKM